MGNGKVKGEGKTYAEVFATLRMREPWGRTLLRELDFCHVFNLSFALGHRGATIGLLFLVVSSRRPGVDRNQEGRDVRRGFRHIWDGETRGEDPWDALRAWFRMGL